LSSLVTPAESGKTPTHITPPEIWKKASNTLNAQHRQINSPPMPGKNTSKKSTHALAGKNAMHAATRFSLPPVIAFLAATVSPAIFMQLFRAQKRHMSAVHLSIGHPTTPHAARSAPSGLPRPS
jgi:hypothetical protein